MWYTNLIRTVPTPSTASRSVLVLVVTLGVVIFGHKRLLRTIKALCAADSDLPIGLPNPRNACYLNALLQAMSTNASLVRYLKRRARVCKTRLLYALVCLLKGLRCSNRYVTTHNLEGTLQKAHAILIEELGLMRNWSPNDQQDVHELFNFLMDLACHQSAGYTALKADEGLTLFSQFIGPRYEQIAPRCFHRTYAHSAPNSYTIKSPLQTEVFQQHLLVSQVKCESCDYRSSPVLQPEACLTVFFDASPTVPNPVRPQRSRSAYKKVTTKCPGRPIPKLVDCLAKQFGVCESLPDLPCPKCQTIQRQEAVGHCKQERWIAHLPPCLVLHIQRSAWVGGHMTTHWGSMLGIGSKRSDYVQFPRRLDMANYMLSGKSSTQSPFTHRRRNGSGDFTVRNALSQMHARQPRTYVLRSVIVHQGEFIYSGHYVTYRSWRRADHTRQKRKSLLFRAARFVTRFVINFFYGIVERPMHATSPWILTSDKHVIRVPDQEVRSSSAYLLFYEREPPNARSERSLSRWSVRGRLNGWATPTSGGDGRETDWEHQSDDKSTSLLEETEDDEADSAYGPDEEYDDEDDDGEESDEPSDVGDDLIGHGNNSKADVIRAFALAASQV